MKDLKHQCAIVIPGTFIICGEDNYQYCSQICMERAKKMIQYKHSTKDCVFYLEGGLPCPDCEVK